MSQFTFTAPINISAEDNESLITKALVKFRSADEFDSPSGDFWNCNRCPNDDDYCQPYIIGDKIYFQLKYIPFIDSLGNPAGSNSYWAYINNEAVEVSDGSNGVTIQEGVGVEDEINYVNVEIDTLNSFWADKNCWYFQIATPNCEIEVDGLGNITSPLAVKNCFDAKILAGIPYQQAYDECVYSECTDKYNTEFYCLVQCNESTLLIEGEYESGYDCEGKYYGDIDDGFNYSPNLYKPIFRIRGVIEPEGFEFEETRNVSIKVKSKQREAFTLYSKKIPYYVVKQLSTCWNSKQLTIDGIDYIGSSKLSKNFDEGLMWILKETLFIDCDEINFTCN